MSRAPKTLPRAPHWTDTAACAHPAYLPIRDFWFADDSNTNQTRTATTICGHCPVKDACLAAAVAEEKGRGKPSMFGIRGGLTATERWTQKDRKTRGKVGPPRPLSPCGTVAAYERHSRNGEPIDDACRAAHTEYRRKQRQQQPRQTGCGTRPGYRAHLARGEDACAPCRQANADADRRLRNTGTTKPKPPAPVTPVTEDSRLAAGVARCGTTDGYKAHRRWSEKACQPCLDAHRAAARKAADVPSLPSCGTRSGYDTHTDRGEAPCRPCTEARARTDWLLRTTTPERSAA